ncbi:MAG: acetyl-CoA C-acyltransferase [Planctomycetes bacterium]|nr:acetyl-CoA C-acyltransferase [Planctomycetota bacterium]
MQRRETSASSGPVPSPRISVTLRVISQEYNPVVADTNEAVLVAWGRTPVGRFLGALSDLAAPDLAASLVRHLVSVLDLKPEEVDEVILGTVVQAGQGQNPARQAALRGGLPPTVSAFTVNKVCGSGLKAVHLAAQTVRLGEARVVLAGGMESMSQAPFLLQGVRRGQKLGHGQMKDALVHDGLWCAFEDWHMGSAADHTARTFDITREAQDRFAAESHRRAVAARESGVFKDEIVPVNAARAGKPPQIVYKDEGPRADVSPESLARLSPAFGKDGTVTAGNASQLSDGAALVAVCDEATARKRGWPIRARIRSVAVAGVPPKEIFRAPVPAVRLVLERAGWSLDQVDALELNEAFSAQVLANHKELGWNPERANQRGGAVALGHPIGASGARVLVTLGRILEDTKGRRGLAGACLGGGNAIMMAIERDA